ncbi:DUF4870 domain-containing protein [Staphylococcus caeli]|uniref:DUF4870 domain-containing protein n=1 Tax=Staphylococcus caeli TaxID=2201815 RepID=UPI003F560C3D
MNNQTFQQNTQSERVLAAICYLSIFFAPLIVPIAVWIFASKPTSSHAAKSLVYHIITYLGPIFLIISAAMSGVLLNHTSTTLTVISITIAIILLILTIWYTIKNVYRGIMVLISEDAFFRP